MDDRYARQVVLPGFGAGAQARLASARVLVIGAGGLGSAVIPALAGAGVGVLGIMDDDVVEVSNLHRQLIHRTEDLGTSKAQSAARAATALNPRVTIVPLDERLTAENAGALFSGYDLVVDGSDNFASRYVANDAAVLAGIPLVWGAVSQFAGQAGVSWGTTYRDLFPVPPDDDAAISCESGGVLPTTVGVIGAIMATETIKMLTGVGRPLIGRVTFYDALTGSFREVEYARNPDAAPIAETTASPAPPIGITAAELASRLDDVTLIDVRERWEFELGAIPGARLIPIGQWEADRMPEGIETTRTVVVYCQRGIRSVRARDLLSAQGVDVVDLAGGYDSWAKESASMPARS